MIQAGSLSSGAFVAARSDSNYFASDRHYEALARRIIAALRSGGRCVLVTGDPPPQPEILSLALSKVAGPQYEVIDIPCGPQLTPEELKRAVSILERPCAKVGAEMASKFSAPASQLFVFVGTDRLSDRQIADLCQGTLSGDQAGAAGVLLAHQDFIARLEGPALHSLKERLAAHFSAQQLGGDEDIAFLHNQLLVQRDRRIEARWFRRGLLIGLAPCGVILAASIGAFLLLNPNAEHVCEEPASTEKSWSVTQLPAPAVPPTAPDTAFPPAPPPPPGLTLSATKMEPPPPVAPPDPAQPPAAPHLSAREIAAFMGRGDALLSAGDIASARLFYERAAEAGDGPAALQLGATFDPMFLGRARVRGITADPGRAYSWYRRARELGVDEAEGRMKGLEARGVAEPDTR